MVVISETQALKLEAAQQFYDDREGVERVAGDNWLLPGPVTYFPRIEERISQVVDSQLIAPNSALRIIAINDCKDFEGKNRRAGEEWLMRKTGHYLPGIHEQIVGVVSGYILTDEKVNESNQRRKIHFFPH